MYDYNIEADSASIFNYIESKRYFMSTKQIKDKASSEENGKEEIPSFKEKFIEKLEALDPSKDKIAIFTHHTPDPDAMGAARGLQWLLSKKFGLQSEIFYEGEVSHPQNKTMVNILDLHLKTLDDVNLDAYDLKISVDSTEKNCPTKNIDVVIDHHRISSNADLTLIEPIGSASTLICELIKDLEVSFEDEIDQDVATALFIGIRVDTAELISETTTDRDFEFFKFLSNQVNRKKLASIIDYPIPSYFFELERELNREDAEGNCINQTVDGSCFVGCVGIISQTKRDFIPMLADKVVRMEGVQTSVIFGIVEDKIVASIRSQNSSLDVNAFAQTIFGKEYGGGKLGSAGASVPLGIFGFNGIPNELRKTLWSSIKEVVFYKVIHVATGN
jgi:nanoRNase/pAp phosphatase (c-di-AMP/oligoRNAs hydrolase)